MHGKEMWLGKMVIELPSLKKLSESGIFLIWNKPCGLGDLLQG